MSNVPKFPNFGLDWEEDTSKFTEDFIKNYDEKSEIGYIFEVDIKYLENYLKGRGLKRLKSLLPTYMTKLNK